MFQVLQYFSFLQMNRLAWLLFFILELGQIFISKERKRDLRKKERTKERVIPEKYRKKEKKKE